MSKSSAAAASETNTLPPPAPATSDPALAAATDSQGIRKHDAESIKPHMADPASGKKKSKTAPKSSTPFVPATSAPVNDLRQIARLRPTRPVKDAAPNWFIPFFGMMFALLGTMCDKTCALRSFGERGTVNDWIPQSAFLVYGFLAIVQVLRAQQIAGLITPDQHQFLEFFLSRFPLETIVIPGPLVHFFRSISISNPGFGNFADVTPAIPPMTFNEEYAFRMIFSPDNGTTNTHLTQLLPHIPLLYSELVRLVSDLLSNATHTFSADFTMLDTTFGVSSAATGNARTGRNSLLQNCATAFRPTAADPLFRRFANYLVNHAQAFPAPWNYDASHAGDATTTPPTPASWSETSSFFDFMMMNENCNWFAVLLRGQGSFLSHWTGNATLLSIYPSTSTAACILFKQVEQKTLTAPTVFGNLTSKNSTTQYLGFSCSYSTTCPFVTNEDSEDAQIAMINIETTTTTSGPGALNHTRFGPFWSVTPAVDVSDKADISEELRNMVVSTVYFDAAGKQN